MTRPPSSADATRIQHYFLACTLFGFVACVHLLLLVNGIAAYGILSNRRWARTAAICNSLILVLVAFGILLVLANNKKDLSLHGTPIIIGSSHALIAFILAGQTLLLSMYAQGNRTTIEPV
jgi:hypothetical protein